MKITEKNLTFYDLICKYKRQIFKEKLALFEQKPFAQKPEEEKSMLKNIDKLKLIVMIDLAEDYGCKSFEEFIDLGSTDAFLRE